MHVRQKGQAIRVTLADTSKPHDIPYISINAPRCWSATFNAWGKKIDAPVIEIGGKQFKIILEAVSP